MTAELPRKLSRASPKGTQLRSIMEDLIETLKPGDPLPSERELAERYGVARMTVRAEITRLAAEGRVERVQGRGTFVAEARVAQAATLSSFTEDMRARGLKAGSHVLGQGTEPADDLVACRLGIEPGAFVVRLRRVRTADGEPMALEEAFLPAEHFGALADEDLDGLSLFTVLEERFGARFPSADQQVVAVEIVGEDANLLRVAPGRAGLKFHTILLDGDERPLAYAWSLFRGDRYEIRLRQERRGVTHGSQMAAEMAEQPRVLAALAGRRGELIAELRAAVGGVAPVGIVLVARGSSDNAAVFGRYVLELATRRPVALAAPSLVTRYGAQDRLDGWLAVGVSQSGRTPEIVSVLESFGASGARTVAITNDRESPLAGAADATIDTAAGTEQAVPATKTVTSQFAAFAVLAEALAGDARRSRLPWDDGAWAALPDAVGELLGDGEPARAAASAVGSAQGLVVIARGLLLGAALEAALKVKEMTGVLAEGASAADFLHGPIAVVHRGLPVLTLAAGGPTAADVAEFAAAARERGGRVLAIAPDGDLSIPVSIGDGLAAIPAIVRAQQLARELSLLRGIDPDAPFGLSKVTATR